MARLLLDTRESAMTAPKKARLAHDVRDVANIVHVRVTPSIAVEESMLAEMPSVELEPPGNDGARARGGTTAALVLTRLRRSVAELCALCTRATEPRSDGAPRERVLARIEQELRLYQSLLEDELADSMECTRYGALMREHVLRCCASQRARMEALIAGKRLPPARERVHVIAAAALVLKVELEDLARDASYARLARRAWA